MDIEKRGRGAPPGSKNRQLKPDQEGATSWVQIRCKPGDKAGWVKAAGGSKLSEWVIKTLNDAAGK